MMLGAAFTGRTSRQLSSAPECCASDRKISGGIPDKVGVLRAGHRLLPSYYDYYYYYYYYYYHYHFYYYHPARPSTTHTRGKLPPPPGRCPFVVAGRVPSTRT